MDKVARCIVWVVVVIIHDPYYSLQICDNLFAVWNFHEATPALLHESQAASRHRDLEIMQGQLKMAKMRTSSTHRNSGHQVGQIMAADGSDGSDVVDVEGFTPTNGLIKFINKYMG